MIWDRISNKIDSIFNKSLTSDDTKKIEKQLNRGKEVEIDPKSKRWYQKGSNGSYLDDDAVVGSMEEYSGDDEVEIPSTAIKKVKYDKKSGMLKLLYVGGKTWYTFGPVPLRIFNSFMTASSKGRFANKILRPYYRAKGY